jgi:hypothetical protein
LRRDGSRRPSAAVSRAHEAPRRERALCSPLLDWDNRPHPFKEYRGLEALPPPHGLLRYDMPALEAPAEGSAQRRAAELGLPDLARHGQLWVKPKESLTAEKYDTFS